MIIAFVGLSVLLAAFMMWEVVKIRRHKQPMRRYVQYLFAAASVTILFNALSVILPGVWLATLFHGLYFAATDWLVVVLLLYVMRYTDAPEEKGVLFYVLAVGAGADTGSMLVNMFTHHVFRCGEVTAAGWGRCLTVVEKYPIYNAHLVYVSCAVLTVLGTLLAKTIRTIPMYRRKYETVMLCFVMILSVNVVCRFLRLPVDLSTLAYSALAPVSYYFALFYVPKGIMAKLLSLSVADMESGIICFDRDGKCVYANEQGKHIFGAEGNVEPLERFYAQRKGTGEIEDFQEGVWSETFIIDKKAHEFDVQFKLLLDGRGRYIGCFFTMDDRTEDRRKLEQQRYRATHDQLTDVYNRERFFERVREVLDAEPDVRRVIVCTDIKDFKVVNDLFGEKTGNMILQKVAEIMHRECSADTIYGRLVADRFVMCMREENFHEETYRRYLEELKKIIQSSVYRMHVHVGVYRITDPKVSVSVMCDRARMAIREIKEDYQQIVSYYSDSMGSAVQKEQIMVGEFDRAIRAEEFQMYLQPQVSSSGQKLLGAEALVRWDHPVRGMVSPAEFIPVFEKSGYIPRLDLFMWEQACKQLRAWKERGLENLHISVNISPKDFYYIDIYDTFTKLVEKYGISPAHLKLEITETALMEEMSKQMGLLQRLRDYGFHVEIDDFGSGYSSLNTLKDIEVDVLKLDMGFLRDTGHKERSRVIMNATIAMAKELGLTVVTEGVETVEQVEYLTQVGCDIFQGYYFAKPLPVRAFEEKYAIG